MKRIFSMATKDLRLLARDKMGAFFIVVFPILMGLFFGLMMGGIQGGGSTSKMKVAVVDQDDSEISKKFVELLAQNNSLAIESVELEPARQSVRKGARTAFIVLTEGFGETAGVFWEQPPVIQIGSDPSRMAEAGMLQGYVMEGIGQLVQTRFQDPTGLLDSVVEQRKLVDADKTIDPTTRLLLGGLFGSVESMIENMDALQSEENGAGSGDSGNGPNFNFADIQSVDITREIDPKSVRGQLQKIRSQWDISFPQAMMWGVLACAAGFAISIAQERTNGTMIRLQVAPVSRFDILAGKALACFFAVLLVIGLMMALGFALGMRPGNIANLLLASICIAICFVGIMMTMSVLGKTEQAVGGAGWAINMVMAMLGGAMMPVMFMPSVVQKLSIISPIKWAILALEGAIWREFTLAEMLLPCGLLLAFGAIGLAIGTYVLRRSE